MLKTSKMRSRAKTFFIVNSFNDESYLILVNIRISTFMSQRSPYSDLGVLGVGRDTCLEREGLSSMTRFLLPT